MHPQVCTASFSLGIICSNWQPPTVTTRMPLAFGFCSLLINMKQKLSQTPEPSLFPESQLCLNAAARKLTSRQQNSGTQFLQPWNWKRQCHPFKIHKDANIMFITVQWDSVFFFIKISLPHIGGDAPCSCPAARSSQLSLVQKNTHTKKTFFPGPFSGSGRPTSVESNNMLFKFRVKETATTAWLRCF